MSDTPKTDANESHAYEFDDDMQPVVDSRFARTLERELTAANDKIRRLEEALKWIVDQNDAGQFISNGAIHAARAALDKAKESNP